MTLSEKRLDAPSNHHAWEPQGCSLAACSLDRLVCRVGIRGFYVIELFFLSYKLLHRPEVTSSTLIEFIFR